MKILETDRLILREIVESDGEFILDLLNQPSFIKYIGDRNVRTVDEARDFIENRYRASYAEHGFGLYTVELKTETRTLVSMSNVSENTLADARVSALEKPIPIGICGFVKRETLPDADIGFAFLPQFEKQGFAFESANAMMIYGRDVLGLKKVLAITTKDNESSGKLLAKLGFVLEGEIENNDELLKLFSFEWK
ncbi:MAG TPA: GNAT family N-acetyltransferase [Pyrinomonadaceae bacterium]|mgnify:CR=1 FL=1|nr:GNAT family N-acetyltransferase [Pyrinomonadaceae bacterium]